MCIGPGGQACAGDHMLPSMQNCISDRHPNGPGFWSVNVRGGTRCSSIILFLTAFQHQIKDHKMKNNMKVQCNPKGNVKWEVLPKTGLQGAQCFYLFIYLLFFF